MNILLIGNYSNNRQQSMQRFAELMRQCLEASGHEVRLVYPPAILGWLRRGETGLAKWIGYIDRFLLYPILLRWQIRTADIVHICDHANAVYIPHLRGKPHVVTCHDMLAIRSAMGEIPDNPTRWSGRIYQRWILKNLCKSQLVVCVSRQTQGEVIRITGLDTGRVMFVPNALNYAYRPIALDEASPRLRFLGLDAAQPFFLHVGGNQWYKNRAGVLRIFSELIRLPSYQNHNLVMAGKPWTDELRQIVKKLGLEERVYEIVEVSNDDLCVLYSAAEALLFPSLQEGFGWPIIEAQACGCPVAVTNRLPMTEVAGRAAISIDPSGPEEAAGIISEGLSDRKRLQFLGFQNAEKYSRKSMTEGYAEIYQAALQNGRSASWCPSVPDKKGDV